MRYGKVPGLDKEVSRLVQGIMMISVKNLDHAFSLLDAAFETGVNTFDSAHVYGGGNCDRAFGRWVADRGVRDKVMLIDKCCHFNGDRTRVSEYDITSDLHDCLARLKFDYIDIFMLHRDDKSVPVSEIIDRLNRHIGEGKVRALGASNWTHTRIAEANEYARQSGQIGFALSSPNFSLAEMIEPPWDDCLSIAGPEAEEARRWYGQQNMPLFTWSSIAHGFFSGRFDRKALEARGADDQDIPVKCFRSEDNLKRLDRAGELAREKNLTVPQIAAAYVFNYPLNLFPLIGAHTPQECKANAEAVDVKLTEKELAWLDLRSDTR
ncbi:MAG: aldo/keto reductase [Planctomycetes bacterium]|nr:aldo/keto reductase [Planctomycetota bacterium]